MMSCVSPTSIAVDNIDGMNDGHRRAGTVIFQSKGHASENLGSTVFRHETVSSKPSERPRNRHVISTSYKS